MGLLRWFTCNWADTAEPSHPDLNPPTLPLPPTAAIHQIQTIVQSLPRWRVERVNGKPVTATTAHRTLRHPRQSVYSALTPRPREAIFLDGPDRPDTEWMSATRRSRLIGFVDDVLIWLESVPDGCRVHARSRSRAGKGDLGQNRRNLLELFAALEPLRSVG